MLFLSDTRDLFTRMLLFMEFGGEMPRFDAAVFGEDPLIRKVNTRSIPLSSHTLLLDKETGSWCICNEKELEVLDAMEGKRLNEILTGHGAFSPLEIKEFITELYCRGLLLIDDRSFYNHNVFKNDYISTGKALFLIIPTTRCNLSCRYCSGGNSPVNGRTMDFETAKRVIDLIMDFRSAHATILFHGGEPLLEFELVESVLRYARGRNRIFNKALQFRLQTNGTLLTRDIARRLARLNIGLGISFDGDHDINDKTRVRATGRSSFDDALEGLANAQMANMQFGSICVLNRHNFNKIPVILDFYSRNGLHSIKINPVSKLGRADHIWKDIGISPDQNLQSHIRYLDYLKENGNDTPKEENICHMINNLSSRMSTYMCMRSQCGAGKDFFAFTPEGDIYPCDRYRYNKDFLLGNVFAVSDLSVIREKNQTVTDMFRRNINNISECSQCDYKLFCRGGCTMETFSSFEDIDRPNPWCDYYKKMYKELFQFIDLRPDLASYLCGNVRIYNRNFFSSELSENKKSAETRNI